MQMMMMISVGGRGILPGDPLPPPLHGEEELQVPGGKSAVLAVVPAVFLFCCVSLCPCFRTRRKEESDLVVLPKEMNANSGREYTMGKFLRVGIPSAERTPPGSSLRGGVGTPQSRFPKFPKSPQFRRNRSAGGALWSIDQIARTTQNFSTSHKIGEGGFGSVYKAVLEDGLVVAVKRARKEYFAAERTEFNNEVEMLSKINHRNLVRIVGCIEEGTERLLITEYVPNGTLREHLDGKHGTFLDFSQRLEIAIDVAHALTYLHMYAADKPIIHRDVKSSKVLLTESYRAKVTGFGIAKAGTMTDEGNSHILTRVKGTAGYLDPDYVKTNKLTARSDVYSFGVLLLEIISGRRPVELNRPFDEKFTVRWAFGKFNEECVGEILDPTLGEVVDGDVVRKMLRLAFHCVSPIRNERPMMKVAVEKLWEIRKQYRRSSPTPSTTASE